MYFKEKLKFNKKCTLKWPFSSSHASHLQVYIQYKYTFLFQKGFPSVWIKITYSQCWGGNARKVYVSYASNASYVIILLFSSN